MARLTLLFQKVTLMMLEKLRYWGGGYPTTLQLAFDPQRCSVRLVIKRGHTDDDRMSANIRALIQSFMMLEVCPQTERRNGESTGCKPSLPVVEGGPSIQITKWVLCKRDQDTENTPVFSS